jgi:hypothetical protein
MRWAGVRVASPNLGVLGRAPGGHGRGRSMLCGRGWGRGRSCAPERAHGPRFQVPRVRSSGLMDSHGFPAV